MSHERDFQMAVSDFTQVMRKAGNWHSQYQYLGTAAQRLRQAIWEAKIAIAQLEAQPEIGEVELDPMHDTAVWNPDLQEYELPL